ncbi:tyrosine-protein phosphatase [Mesobacillus selenatarsenatis]|uniref:Tyrosine-protein phosphatase n=1 Tax=Mesobacillus selenatarsenatis TaxID=388741 RepID=A0A846TH01_9BACI|nr:CpsB/CapC family capsule biosynthesis tyrosine phosphatase [Mesobacillus selenatarsenatis]NKE04697.1 tyrosine protein phosphatase [Mesobacillus selenatarsenatis]
MIDLHCHILAGIDDGAQTMAESIEMARAAVNEGIDTIIATPHHKNGRYENSKQVIIQKTDELNEVLKAENIPMTILPGQEPAIHGELLKGITLGEVSTLNNTQYIFIELPAGHVPRYTDQLLYDLQMEGKIPVIVHPERNQEIIERPEILYQLIKNGAFSQVTASSVCGIFGKKIKTFSEQLIEANLTHFIASDAHNTNKRTYHMAEAFNKIDTRYGVDMMYLFKENAELLIRDQNVYKEVPQRVKKKKFLGLF